VRAVSWVRSTSGQAAILVAVALLGVRAGAQGPPLQGQIEPVREPAPSLLAQAPGPDPGAPADPNAPASGPQTFGPLRPAPPDPPEDDLGPSPLPEDPESMLGSLLKMFLMLALVLGAVYLTLNHGLRRLMGVRAVPLGAEPLVRVVERIPLDPKRSMFVVQAAGEYLLIGGGEQGLSLLGKLDSDEVERLLGARRQAASIQSPFLQKLLSRKAGPPPPEPKV
jgi:flagellar protein FliO/FliZ